MKSQAVSGFDHVSLPLEHTDASSVYTRDPDGNLLEFMNYP